jgi:hypothetical protein
LITDVGICNVYLNINDKYLIMSSSCIRLVHTMIQI